MMTMDEGAKRWLYRTAKRHYWRVWEWYGIDALIQDGHMHYARLCARYPNVTERKHMMSLFQVTFLNHINSLSVARTRENEASLELLRNLAGFSEPEGATFQALVAQAPPPVRRLIELIASPTGCKKLRSRYRVKPTGERETLNERLCRLVGVDPASCDLPSMIRQHFTGGEQHG